MAKRLVKIAKELNVGTSTIVEHLIKKGFDVNDSPRAKITEEMYEVLLKDFRRSIAIKEQAAQLTIGTRKRKEAAERRAAAERAARERERLKRLREEEERRRKLAEIAAKKAIEDAQAANRNAILNTKPPVEDIVTESKTVEEVIPKSVQQPTPQPKPSIKPVVKPIEVKEAKVEEPVVKSNPIEKSNPVEKVIAPIVQEKPPTVKPVVTTKKNIEQPKEGNNVNVTRLKILGKINLERFNTNNNTSTEKKEGKEKVTAPSPKPKTKKRERVARKRTIPQSKQRRLLQDKHYDKSHRKGETNKKIKRTEGIKKVVLQPQAKITKTTLSPKVPKSQPETKSKVIRSKSQPEGKVTTLPPKAKVIRSKSQPEAKVTMLPPKTKVVRPKSQPEAKVTTLPPKAKVMRPKPQPETKEIPPKPLEEAKVTAPPKVKVTPSPNVTPPQSKPETKVVPSDPPVSTPKLPEKEQVEVVPPKEEAPVNELVRAETPKLKGLKILGKIDPNRFKKPKKRRKGKDKDKPKTKATETPTTTPTTEKERKPVAKKEQAKTSDKKTKTSENIGGKSTEGNVDNKRRRRKRKKVVKTTTAKTGTGTGSTPLTREKKPTTKPVERKPRTSAGGNKTTNKPDRSRRRKKATTTPPVTTNKEVSQKEIQEKIKATMARISGRGKNKRQKLRRNNRERQREQQNIKEAQEQVSAVQVTEFVSVSELASLLNVSVTDVIMTCMNAGVIVSINQRLDSEIIELVAGEFDQEVEFISAEEQLEEEEEIVDDPKDLKSRAPIVTVMGHVDHGKTSLLDYIREANVAAGEAGGITQHIGAYEVVVGEDRNKITFLDTPGHEAFTAMRARGAKVTDIAIIIIAADDDVMPQTKEAISHAQAAGVPIIFAINKIDKPGAKPERIKEQLSTMNLLVEDWGGNIPSQDISAKTGLGIDDLLEKVLFEAELLELKANPKRLAQGVVLEASLDKGRGYVTKMLVQTGTLKVGDPMVAGAHAGKVKAMFNERNKRVKKVGPSSPVLVLGLGGAPQAGEKFKVMDSEQEAKQLASKRARIIREQQQRATKRITLDDIGKRLNMGNFKELNLIVKGDVDGSIEALSDALLKQSIENLQINIVHRAVGQITESDVLLAAASEAIIIGFQVRPSISSKRLAEKEGVDIRLYSVIYDAIEEVRDAMEGMLDTRKEKEIIGNIEVREVYKISKVGTIAGCYVMDGKVTRNSFVTVVRNGIVVFPMKEGQQGEVGSLRRYKDDVKEVAKGFECGMTIKNFNDIRIGDEIEAYEIIEVKQTLEDFKKANVSEQVEA